MHLTRTPLLFAVFLMWGGIVRATPTMKAPLRERGLVGTGPLSLDTKPDASLLSRHHLQSRSNEGSGSSQGYGPLTLEQFNEQFESSDEYVKGQACVETQGELNGFPDANQAWLDYFRDKSMSPTAQSSYESILQTCIDQNKKERELKKKAAEEKLTSQKSFLERIFQKSPSDDTAVVPPSEQAEGEGGTDNFAAALGNNLDKIVPAAMGGGTLLLGGASAAAGNWQQATQ